MNYYDEVRHIISSHKDLMQAVESNANSLADLLEPNLRSISKYRLQRIKKELGKFNSNTGRWKK